MIGYYCAEHSGLECVLLTDVKCSYPLHNHVSVITIGMILSGKICLNISGKICLYREDEFFVIRPYEPHRIIALESYGMICLCIDKKLVHELPVERILEFAGDILAIALQEKVVGVAQIRSFLAAVERTKHTIEGPAVMIVKSPLVSLRKEIELYPEVDFNVAEMSEKVFLSQYHFIRLFKRLVGLTPHQFQLQNRIRKAKRLLGQNSTLTEIALSTGFCDQSHFIRTFKKNVLLTPSGYQAVRTLVDLPF